jgi:hypothetical protein
MSAEFRSMSLRIHHALTLADILKLERSLDRCWVAGCFTAPEFARLDQMILSRKIRFD